MGTKRESRGGEAHTRQGSRHPPACSNCPLRVDSGQAGRAFYHAIKVEEVDGKKAF